MAVGLVTVVICDCETLITMQLIHIYLHLQELGNSLFQSTGFAEQAQEAGFTVETLAMPNSVTEFQSQVNTHPQAYVVVSWQALCEVFQPVVAGMTHRAEAEKMASVSPPPMAFTPTVVASHALQQDVESILTAFQKSGVSCANPFILLYPGALSSKTMQRILHAGFEDVIQAAKPSVAILNQLLQLHKLHQRLILQHQQIQHMEQLHHELNQRNLLMEKELDKTRTLQMSLLPPDISSANAATLNPFSCVKLHHQTQHCSIHGLYLPCDAIGGDLYDLITFQDETLGLLMSDVSGHGVPAAFVTAMLKSAFYKITHNHHRPDNVLFHLNNQLAGVVKTGDYSTAIYCHLNEQTKTLEFAGAGHPYPLHYSAATQAITRLEENGTPLVWVPDMPYLQQTVHVGAGDKILIFTDGISELMNSDNEMLGEDRLQQLFLDVILSEAQGQECLECMLGHLSDFAQSHPLQDDMTMMLLEIH